jgi:hypothetical protein
LELRINDLAFSIVKSARNRHRAGKFSFIPWIALFGKEDMHYLLQFVLSITLYRSSLADSIDVKMEAALKKWKIRGASIVFFDEVKLDVQQLYTFVMYFLFV